MRILSLVLLGFLFLCSNAHAQTRELSATGQMLDGIAAVVNDGIVLKSELVEQMDSIIRRLQAEGTPLPPRRQLAEQVLERLVISEIQRQRAERVGIRVPDEMLNATLADIANRNGTTLAELPNQLAAEGIDYAAYREEMRKQMVIDQLRQRDVLSRISVTQRELEEYMERQEGLDYINDEFEISHILISVPQGASPSQVSAAQARADDIVRRTRSGENFAELAVTYSDGQQALEGGSLGWRKGDQLPTLFAEVVPDMAIGDVTDPFRSASGFNLVRLNDKRGGERVMENQSLVRHILITTNEVMDDEAAKQQLEELRAQILAGDDFAAIASAVSEDPGSAANGGELGWTGPGIFVPEFQAKVESQAIGELGEPFQTPFGWHILEVMDRRVQDTTDDVEKQKAIMAIRRSRLEEETELWARRLRDEAFVEYRL